MDDWVHDDYESCTSNWRNIPFPVPSGNLVHVRNSWRQFRYQTQGILHQTTCSQPLGLSSPCLSFTPELLPRDCFRLHPASWLCLCVWLFSAASWISVSNPVLQIAWLRSVFVVFLWNCDSQCTPFTQNPRSWETEKLVFKTNCRTDQLPGVSTQLFKWSNVIKGAYSRSLFFF